MPKQSRSVSGLWEGGAVPRKMGGWGGVVLVPRKMGGWGGVVLEARNMGEWGGREVSGLWVIPFPLHVVFGCITSCGL